MDADRAARIRALMSAALLVVGLLTACDADGSATQAGATPAARTAGATVEFTAADTWGRPPDEEARHHLTAVLRARLRAAGQDAAGIEFPEPGRLRITVAPGAEDTAVAVTRSNVELRLRIRASAAIENAERKKREDLGEYYTVRDSFAWVPLEIGGEILILVPEAETIKRLEELRAAEEPDEEAIRGAVMELREILLREVFSEADLADAEAASSLDQTSVRLSIRPDRQAAFRSFTQHYLSHFLAIMVDGVVVAAPPLTVPLVAAAEIRKPGAGFTLGEAAALAERLQRAAWGIHLERTK